MVFDARGLSEVLTGVVSEEATDKIRFEEDKIIESFTGVHWNGANNSRVLKLSEEASFSSDSRIKSDHQCGTGSIS